MLHMFRIERLFLRGVKALGSCTRGRSWLITLTVDVDIVDEKRKPKEISVIDGKRAYNLCM